MEPNRRRLFTVLLLCGSASAQNTTAVPGRDFDLAGWNLQLPVGKSGGGVQEIKGAELEAGYSSSYFNSGADGSMTFWCPVTGATTQGSHYPRSELREVAVGGDWTFAGHHEFSATCRVLSVPSTGRVIIGQIHGHADESEIMKLMWDNGQVGAAVEPSRFSEKILPLGNYKLGDTLKYRVEMTAGILKVTVGSKSITYDYTAATWKGDTYYFKAGSYVQDDAGPATEGGKVAFYALDIPHPTGLAGPGSLAGNGSRGNLAGAGWNIGPRRVDAAGRRLRGRVRDPRTGGQTASLRQ